MIKDNVRFKTSPDLFLARFELPDGINDKKEQLDGSLYIRIMRNKKGFTKYYYFGAGTCQEKIDNIDNIRFSTAKKEAEIKLKNYNERENKYLFKNVYNAFLEAQKDYRNTTIKKKNNAFKNAEALHLRDIRVIKFAEIKTIAEALRDRGVVSQMREFFTLCSQIFEYALANDLLENNIMAGRKYTHISSAKGGNYPYFDSIESLKNLAYFIYTYPHSEVVRNALLFGFLTGLRNLNVCGLETFNLKNDNGYYLEYSELETKSGGSNGHEYLGLPKQLGEWLLNLTTENNYFFPSTKDNKHITINTTTKALRTFRPHDLIITSTTRQNFCFHSFRMVLSTFVYNNLKNSNLTEYDIERTLFHSQGKTQKTYNKSNNIENSRAVLEWWLGYINSQIGFNILGDKK